MLLTDEELDVLAKPFSGMGGVEDYRAYARAVSAACEAKLREQQEPIAKVSTSGGLIWTDYGFNNGISDGTLLYANPAPIPEGWRCPVCNTDLKHEHAYNCMAARSGE